MAGKQYAVRSFGYGCVCGSFPYDEIDDARKEAAQDSEKESFSDVIITEESVDDDGQVIQETVFEVVKGSSAPFVDGIAKRNAQQNGNIQANT